MLELALILALRFFGYDADDTADEDEFDCALRAFTVPSEDESCSSFIR